MSKKGCFTIQIRTTSVLDPVHFVIMRFKLRHKIGEVDSPDLSLVNTERFTDRVVTDSVHQFRHKPGKANELHHVPQSILH